MTKQDLSVTALKQGLTTRFIGRNIVYYPRLPSTMDAARREARKGAAEGTVVIAGEQTRGRGRLKRHWFSPGGNIAISVILYPKVNYLPYLIMIASLAVSYGIESVTGLKTRIKWPNDVLIEGEKVAGILIKNAVKGTQAAVAVIGIGINVSLQPDDVPEIAAIATGLQAKLGKQVSREDVLRSLFQEFERLYLFLPDAGPVFKAWRNRLITLGEKVKVSWGEDTLEGIAESVDESGALMIRTTDGALIRVVAGDVTLREE